MHWHAPPLANPRALTGALLQPQQFLILSLLQLPHEVLFPLFPLLLLLPQDYSTYSPLQFRSRLKPLAQEVLPLGFCRVCNCQLLHYWQHVTRSGFKRSANSRSKELSFCRGCSRCHFFRGCSSCRFHRNCFCSVRSFCSVLSSLQSCAVQSRAVETKIAAGSGALLL